MIKMVTDIQKENMLHALGLKYVRKDWKPETVLRKAYRNKFFVYERETDLDMLVDLGYMKRLYQSNHPCSHNQESYFYYVTVEGVKFLQGKQTEQ